MKAHEATTPPAHDNAGAPLVVLYDGECRFCTAGAARLARLARPGALSMVSSKDPVQLARFPQVSSAAANRALQVVRPDGTVCSGAAAGAAALNTRPAWRLITWLYRVPGVRHLADAMYALVAANRYRIAGRSVPCDSGTCPTSPGGPMPRSGQPLTPPQ